jgi:predicted DNA-binding protein
MSLLSPKMKRVSIFLSPEQIEQLNQLALKLDRPVARIVRQAVDQLLAKPPEYPRLTSDQLTSEQRSRRDRRDRKKSLSK